MILARYRLISSRAPLRALVESDGRRGYGFVSIAATTLAQLSSRPLLQLFKRPPNLSQLEIVFPAS